MRRRSRLAEIERLDPVRDYERIFMLSSDVEFAWETRRALELTLFRGLAMPRTSRLLDSTSEFKTDEVAAQSVKPVEWMEQMLLNARTKAPSVSTVAAQRAPVEARNVRAFAGRPGYLWRLQTALRRLARTVHARIARVRGRGFVK